MKITEKRIRDYQSFWENSKYLTDKTKKELYLLSNDFIERLKEHDWETVGIVFIYPDECSDFDALCELANATHGCIKTNQEGVKLIWEQ